MPVLMVTNLLYVVGRLCILPLYNNYYGVLAVTVIGSGVSLVGFRNGYVVVAEMTNDRGRNHLYIIGWVMWVAGGVTLPVVAWLCKEWFSYLLITTLANVVLFAFYFITPESPRLRLTQGRTADAETIIRRILRHNGEEIPEDLTGQLQDISDEFRADEKARTGIMGLFTAWTLAKLTILMSITLYVLCMKLVRNICRI